MGFFKKLGNAIKKVVQTVATAVTKVVSFVGNVIKGVADTVARTVKDFLKNPLPMLETIGLTMLGVPYNVSRAIVNVANGGDWKKAAIDLGLSYFNAGASPQTSVLKQVLTSASTSAAITALNGGTAKEIANSAVSGGISGYVAQTLTLPADKGGYGFKPGQLDTKMIQNSVTAATSAVLNGKNIGDAVVNSLAVTAASSYVKTSFDYATKNSELLQSAQAYANKAKAAVVDAWQAIKPKADKVNSQASVVEAKTTNYNAAVKKANEVANNVNNGNSAGYTDTQIQQYLDDVNLTKSQYSQSVSDYESAKQDYDSALAANNFNQKQAEFEKSDAEVARLATEQEKLTRDFNEKYVKYNDTVSATQLDLQNQIDSKAAEEYKAEIDRQEAQAKAEADAESARLSARAEEERLRAEQEASAEQARKQQEADAFAKASQEAQIAQEQAEAEARAEAEAQTKAQAEAQRAAQEKDVSDKAAFDAALPKAPPTPEPVSPIPEPVPAGSGSAVVTPQTPTVGSAMNEVGANTGSGSATVTPQTPIVGSEMNNAPVKNGETKTAPEAPLKQTPIGSVISNTLTAATTAAIRKELAPPPPPRPKPKPAPKKPTVPVGTVKPKPTAPVGNLGPKLNTSISTTSGGLEYLPKQTPNPPPQAPVGGLTATKGTATPTPVGTLKPVNSTTTTAPVGTLKPAAPADTTAPAKPVTPVLTSTVKPAVPTPPPTTQPIAVPTTTPKAPVGTLKPAPKAPVGALKPAPKQVQSGSTPPP